MTSRPLTLLRRDPFRPACAFLVCLAGLLVSTVPPAHAQTVNQVAAGLRACNASPIAGLSNQVFATLLCQHPGAVVPIDPGHGVNPSGGAYAPLRMYLRPDARDRVYQFASYGAVSVTDTYRTVVDQYLFGHAARAAGCGGPLAPAGQGRHETGVAIDMNNAASVERSHPAGICCRPLSRTDPVHFECRPGCASGSGSAPTAPGDLQVRAWDILAFKHLWNVNHPGDPLNEGSAAVDGATLARIGDSPAGGFPSGGCAPDHDGDGYTSDVDCNDDDPTIHPGAPELCNGVDDNCNGQVDENLTQACGSNVGTCRQGTQTCTDAAWTACVGAVGPLPERCDGVDNDCNGLIDDGQICEREEAAWGQGVEGGSSDVDGDGRADACVRTAAGFHCLLASGHGFSVSLPGPALSDAEGFDATLLSASVRMGDLDGDGRADVCVQGRETIECWHMDHAGFSERVTTLPLPAGMTNLLLADVNADHRDDVCARGADGLHCHLSRPTGSDREIVLDALSDANGFGNVLQYGTLRMADLDGDHRADVCIRAQQGVRCWRMDTDGFGAMLVGPPWSDAMGFDALAYWSTIRFADVDGDGRADLCARGTDDTFVCFPSNGHGFDGPRRGPVLAGAEGWSTPAGYTTLRLADIDGDGDLDLCGRATDGVHCWLWTGNDFGREIEGPPLSDADGWTGVPYFRSLRMADVTGDGRADLCVRAPDGLRCYESTGEGFPRLWVTGTWRDGDGFTDLARTASLRIAGAGMPTNSGCTCEIPGRLPRTSSRTAMGFGVSFGVVAMLRRRKRQRL